MSQRISIVDYGMGNLRSVQKALQHVAPEADVAVTSDAQAIRRADRVVFPGQGAMPACLRALDEHGLGEAVAEAARAKPFLGLCIGQQMLFEHSAEGDTPGLAILPGRVVGFERKAGFKIPHMGWNEVWQRIPHALWKGVAKARSDDGLSVDRRSRNTNSTTIGFTGPSVAGTTRVSRRERELRSPAQSTAGTGGIDRADRRARWRGLAPDRHLRCWFSQRVWPLEEGL